MIALTAIKGQAEIAPRAYPLGLRMAQAVGMTVSEIFGKGVDLLRLRKGVSKKELALATEIDGGNLNRIISGKQWASPERVEALAKYFGVPAYEVFRIGEQGFVEPRKEEDPRKALLHAAVDQFTDEQLKLAFRTLTDETTQQPSRFPALPAPRPANVPPDPRRRSA